METSTASDSSSGGAGAPWTVVTSPRKGAREDKATSPAQAAGPAAPAAPSKNAAESSLGGDSGPAAAAQSPGETPAELLSRMLRYFVSWRCSEDDASTLEPCSLVSNHVMGLTVLTWLHRCAHA